MPCPTIRKIAILSLCLWTAQGVTASAREEGGKKTTVEVELDPYYASIGLYNSLTGKPIPHMGAVPEVEIYRELIKNFYKPRTLRWSFRGGLKAHGNKYIADSFYLGFRRSRTDFGASNNFWLNNSGFEYVADFSQEKLEPLRHLFLLEKKISTGKRSVFSLGAGFVWTSNKKYSGPLSDKDTGHNSFQFILRPNLEF